jgi:hypothetical protein
MSSYSNLELRVKQLNKTVSISIVGWLIIGIVAYSYCNNLVQTYNSLVGRYNELANNYNELKDTNSKLWDNAFINEANCTAVTIIYYTNFSKTQQIITLSIPYEKYSAYHEKTHSYWGVANQTLPTEYITYNETAIQQIVTTIVNQTQSEEELANALLDFGQDKQHTMSIRYYPTTELKYPIETLVEMGGDCDTHSFLYATLMKAAGFKVLLLFSNETLSDGLYHVATAVHLENPPEHTLTDGYGAPFISNDEKYYFAETTLGGCVGDLPENLNLNFTMIPV